MTIMEEWPERHVAMMCTGHHLADAQLRSCPLVVSAFSQGECAQPEAKLTARKAQQWLQEPLLPLQERGVPD